MRDYNPNGNELSWAELSLSRTSYWLTNVSAGAKLSLLSCRAQLTWFSIWFDSIRFAPQNHFSFFFLFVYSSSPQIQWMESRIEVSLPLKIIFSTRKQICFVKNFISLPFQINFLFLFFLFSSVFTPSTQLNSTPYSQRSEEFISLPLKIKIENQSKSLLFFSHLFLFFGFSFFLIHCLTRFKINHSIHHFYFFSSFSFLFFTLQNQLFWHLISHFIFILSFKWNLYPLKSNSTSCSFIVSPLKIIHSRIFSICFVKSFISLPLKNKIYHFCLFLLFTPQIPNPNIVCFYPSNQIKSIKSNPPVNIEIQFFLP